jgi:hypothetical protein
MTDVLPEKELMRKYYTAVRTKIFLFTKNEFGSVERYEFRSGEENI